jgi:hypothetical protein
VQLVSAERQRISSHPSPTLQSRIVTRVEANSCACAMRWRPRADALEAAQHAQLVSTLLGTLTASTTPEELADHWQRVAQHFDLLLDRPEAIDALEQTLLQLAVRGLLVPQDPTDEPASALLQKIRAEKDRLIATGQIKRDKPLPPITDEEKPFELPVGWEWVRLVPLPPLPEQSRIVTRVTALRRLCADLRQRLAERQSVQARLAEALVANNAQTSTQQEDECHAA